MQARYCPICGKRIEPLALIGTLESSTGIIFAHIFLTNHTEPICSGHHEPREPVPQAFYDAFCAEEEE